MSNQDPPQDQIEARLRKAEEDIEILRQIVICHRETTWKLVGVLEDLRKRIGLKDS